jgi:adenosylcobyric acid synthase
VHDPLLLEPGSDRPAFVVVRGLPADELLAGGIDHGRALAALP